MVEIRAQYQAEQPHPTVGVFVLDREDLRQPYAQHACLLVYMGNVFLELLASYTSASVNVTWYSAVRPGS